MFKTIAVLVAATQAVALRDINNEEKKLPTCDKFTSVNCQPVCSETLTVGCTEARTPNTPDPNRFNGSRTSTPSMENINLVQTPRQSMMNNYVQIIDGPEELELLSFSRDFRPFKKTNIYDEDNDGVEDN